MSDASLSGAQGAAPLWRKWGTFPNQNQLWVVEFLRTLQWEPNCGFQSFDLNVEQLIYCQTMTFQL